MKWIVLAVAVALVGAVMFSRMAAPKGYEKLAMSVDEMKATGALIVDIRTPQEWKDTGVIAGAKLVTFGDADGFLKAVGKDLTDGRPLILVCRSGNRSSSAAAAGCVVGGGGGQLIFYDEDRLLRKNALPLFKLHSCLSAGLRHGRVSIPIGGNFSRYEVLRMFFSGLLRINVTHLKQKRSRHAKRYL